MKYSIKIPLYACLAILLLLAVVAVRSVFDNRKDSGTSKDSSAMNQTMKIKADSLRYWRDKYGAEHAQKQVAIAELAVLKTAYQPIIDSVVDRLKIKSKQLETLTAMGVASGGNVRLKVDTIYKDSSTNYRFSYSDTWIKLNGKIGAENSLDYKTFDSFIVSSYYKRSGFLGLGAKKVYIDAFSVNPHSRVSGLDGLQILKERRKPFGLGVCAGYGWNGNQFSPYIGIGIQYSFIKF